MKLTGYGCSFVYGSELCSPDAAWPALIAQDLGYDYRCAAQPGCGNLQILQQILQHARDDDISIINWTWIDRFDFVDCSTEKWETLRPALDHPHAEYYFKNIHSQYRDMLTNLIYVNTALDFLVSNHKKFVMTCMDQLMLETVQPNWHDPDAVDYLQNKIRPHLCWFDGKDFLDWSRDQGFAISEKWHPLEAAHQAAARLMLPKIRTMT